MSDDYTVTYDDALPFVPAGVRADFPATARRIGSAKVGEFFPGSRRRPISHGTAAGYRAHYRHGTPPCDLCKDAERTRQGSLAPQKVAVCGTTGGYRRHRRRREDACRPCKDANTAYSNSRRHPPQEQDVTGHRTPQERCGGCGARFAAPIMGYPSIRCEDCVHAEETTPACTCLIPAEQVGWTHARSCPRRPPQASAA